MTQTIIKQVNLLLFNFLKKNVRIAKLPRANEHKQHQKNEEEIYKIVIVFTILKNRSIYVERFF